MKIEKDRKNVGWYYAQQFYDGEWFFSSGKSLVEALDRMFDKIYWALDLEKNGETTQKTNN